MAKQYGQRLKILCVLDILRRYSDEQHPLNASEICDYLENMGVSAERKSVYNDIAALSDFGYDIVKSGSPRGWFLGAREFEEPEIYLLADAVRAAKFITVGKSRELIGSAIAMNLDFLTTISASLAVFSLFITYFNYFSVLDAFIN